jgi:hypothetical protein
MEALSDAVTVRTPRGPLTCVLASEPVGDSADVKGRILTVELAFEGKEETDIVRFIFSHTDTAGPWFSYHRTYAEENTAPRVRQLPLPNILDMEAGV